MIMRGTAVVFVAAAALVSSAHAQRDSTQLNAPRPSPAYAQQQARPNSYALIDSALARNTIDDETAHKYRVFAAFGDSRLPAAYRGDDSELNTIPPAVTRVAGLLPTLSAQARAELEPFFKRPADAGSWLELPSVEPGIDDAPELSGPNVSARDDVDAAETRRALQWHVARAVNGRVKVWAQLRYAGDSLKAEQLARAMTNPIWPKLTRLFWDPVSDANLPNNGGGPEFDVYLVHTGTSVAGSHWAGGVMEAQPGNNCTRSPSYLLLDSRFPVGGPRSAGIVQGAAHLLAKAIVLAPSLPPGRCNKLDWIWEATGNWAVHFVYPDVQIEQNYARQFLDYPAKSIDVHSNSDPRGEGAYLFPLYLQLNRDSLVLPAMWMQFERKDPLDGIDAALNTVRKKLEDVFPEFAVANWNRRVAGDYWSRDRLAHSAATADSIAVTIPANGHYEEKLHLDMPYLSAMNYYFQFDATVKTVTFENTVAPVTHARVWGIEKIKGTWQKPDDWSDLEGKTWCRSAQGEEIEELVLVFSNVQWQNPNLTVDPGPNPPLLSAYASGCDGWIGQDSITVRMGDANATILETVVAKLEFEVDSALVIKGMPRLYWKSVGGSITWKATFTSSQCSGAGSGTVSIPSNLDEHAATLRFETMGGKLRHSGESGTWPASTDPTYTVRCPGTSYEQPLMGALGFFLTDADNDEFAPDGKSFSGNYVIGTPPNTTQHIYSFRCRSGC